MKAINALSIRMWLGVQAAMGKLKEEMTNERGDTNLISIIIVLGIVLVLVTIFRSYLETIISKIKSSVTSFNNNDIPH